MSDGYKKLKTAGEKSAYCQLPQLVKTLGPTWNFSGSACEKHNTSVSRTHRARANQGTNLQCLVR